MNEIAEGEATKGAGVRRLLTLDRPMASLIALTAAIFVAMAALNPEKFLRPYNLQSIAFVAPELGLFSIAVMLSMLTGGLDLSIVGVANFSSIVAGLFFHFCAARQGVDVADLSLPVVFAGLLVTVATGAVAGAANGFLIARLKISPILATIGSGQVFTGLSLVLTGGPAIVGYPDAWGFIGNGKVVGIAFPLLVFISAAVAVAVMLARSPFGINLALIGANPKAALFAGLWTSRSVAGSYLMTGMLASVAGVLLSSRTNAARSDFGVSYLLQSVLIAVLGGTNPAGGRASVLGVSVALLALMFLSSGLQLMRFNNFLVDCVWGLFLLGVISLNALSRPATNPSRKS
jgi:simple sugar transport system permease protein